MEKKEIIKSKIQAVPEPTVRRMPNYLTLLRELRGKDEKNISAPAVARILKLDPTQVVKDLSYTGITGKPRVGYSIDELLSALEDFLGYNRQHEAFLVGVGNLGNALIQYQGFKEAGLKIVAAFDVDKNKIGTEISGVPIFDLKNFRNLASRLHISIGIITTPASEAQSVADIMALCEIKAIWNFAPISITVADNMIIQDTHIYANLAVIINKLAQVNNK